VRIVHADLHIHTCLSPCGELDMSPRGIVKKAVSEGIDMIAICDHNTAENTAAVREASQQTALTVLPGMEITSKEEVHITGLFEHQEDVLQIQALIYDHLAGENDAAAFGLQVVVGADGTVRGYNNKLLIGATSLSLDEIVQTIQAINGIAIAAHIDREGFGILGQLGFIPDGLGLDALEVSKRMSLPEARRAYPEYAGYPFLQSSDAHTRDDIGSGKTAFWMEEASFEELRMALRGNHGRRICYEG